MRVIAGICRGRKLKTIKGQSTRPTLNRVKESLFNVLSTVVQDICFLDLFSGSGSIGIEALSRGAKEAVFVERNPKAVQVLRDNLVLCGLLNQAKILSGDVFQCLTWLAKNDYQFQIIFLDPPYGYSLLEELVLDIIEKDLLTEEGIMIVETNKVTSIPDNFETCFKVKENRYGDTKIIYFRRGINGTL